MLTLDLAAVKSSNVVAYNAVRHELRSWTREVRKALGITKHLCTVCFAKY